MKALTICQPYAELIVSGQKLIENRKWNTNFRGELLIHAGKSKEWLREEDDPKAYVYGAIVGVVRVNGVFRYNAQRESLYDAYTIQEVLRGHASQADLVEKYIDWAWGPFCWILAEPRRINPIPYVGAMGLFDVPDQLLAASRADQLTKATLKERGL